MKLSYNWLKDYIDIKDSPEKVGELLTLHTAEVEGVEKMGEHLNLVVVGLVKKIKTHPDADKLLLAVIDDGEVEKQIVCGDLELSEGQYIAFAKTGAKVKWHGEDKWTVLEKAKIRGEISEGMACTGAEIGFSDEMEENVIDLVKDYNFEGGDLKLGVSLNKLMKIEDAVFDIDNKALTHRGDLFCHVGFARELGAIYKKKINYPKQEKLTAGKGVKLNIDVKDKKLCPRYMGVVLENIEVKDSPDWMQARLTAAGMRPINNIVDITNFVMLEYGQPLHAFDLDKLAGPEIIVRTAEKGEKIKTLDGTERKLSEEMLMITDKEKAVAIAGVMGGEDSEVEKKTSKILLESANFNKVSIRKTSAKLGLRTEAVLRFEKGLSTALPQEGLKRCVQLLKEHANAKVVSNIGDSLDKQKDNPVIELNIEHINKLIGIEINEKEITDILKSLDFNVKKSGNAIKVKAPIIRTDVQIPEDVIEEVARIFGYGNIKPKPIQCDLNPPKYDSKIRYSRKVQNVLIDLGFTQVMNYSFYGDKELRNLKFSDEDHIKLANPLSEDQKYLRATLLPGLLNNVESNLYIEDNPKLFELGHIYYPGNEMIMIGGVIVGESEKVFYEAKGLVEMMLNKLNIKHEIKPITDREEKYAKFWKVFMKQADTQIIADNKVLGTLSLMNPEILMNFNISGAGGQAEGNEKSVVYFNFWIDELIKLANDDIKYRPLPKYPEVDIDLSIIVDRVVEWKDIQNAIQKTNKLLSSIELFDVYSGKSIVQNKKSFAMHLKFRAEDRTLEMEEVEKFREEIMNQLNKKFNAIIRK
ncbi:MAG: phenylalanine--tRNA ligase subunit beta [Patescibacteria group bacterium]|nr:phenylalanine--tRNA ligase subunit beta [Patescibacteria group bacterium]